MSNICEKIKILDDLIYTFSKEINKLLFYKKKLNILCFGDSLTKGYMSNSYNTSPYGDTLYYLIKHELKLNDTQFNIDISGVNGERACDMSDRLKILIKNNNYDIIIICGGTNDMGCHMDNTDIIQSIINLHNIILDNIYNKYNTSTVIVTIPGWKWEMDNGINYTHKRNNINNKLLEYYHKKSKAFQSNNINDKHIMILDLYDEIPYNIDSILWDRDGLHFSVKGYQRFGVLVFNTIKQYIINQLDI